MSGKAELLVVEDEFLLRLDLADRLRRAGYVVREAIHAGEAISVLETNTEIGAVITDIEMPVAAMDGLALAAAVAKRWPPCKVIIVSGRPDSSNGSLPAGARFFRKPYVVEEICQALQDWGIKA